MNNFAQYVTVNEVIKAGDTRPRKELESLAKARDRLCQCGQESVWKYAGTGLCFSCTTGEADASEDWELR